MSYKIVVRVLGFLLILEGLLMIPSLLVSVFYGQKDSIAFLISIGLTVLVGFIMSRVKESDKKLRTKEGLAIVSAGWVLASFFGCLPFVISGSIPSFIDAFFETISGLTTTGSTLVRDIEILPKGILFWRSFTHWIGGMGILVFAVAILPIIGVGGFQIFKAESPGPSPDKIVPRVKDTARILYITYISITVLQIVLLVAGGMSLYESAVHTFGTVGTGGFSTRNASVGAFKSTYIHIVITVFMVLSGANFSLYYGLYRGKWRDVIRNGELKLYLGIILASGLFIGLNIFYGSDAYKNIGTAFRDSFFQVGSIITTTGYATVDFDLWPVFSKMILLFLMFVGGCAGSTAGSIKNIRFLVLGKVIKRQVARTFHPNAYIPIKVDGKVVSEDVVSGISGFLMLYIIMFVFGVLLISLEGHDIGSTISSVATTLGNVGPGLGFVGPTRNFADFSPYSKLLFSFLMLMGRLELFTIIGLIAPRAWKNER
ncbi:MAG: TrkH family potassium uptake protein [Clostridiales bacterium]|mgnify:CR=1 FL=1|nr:TrkH family potassium uptake protein [Clostridiales bacterium]